MRTSRWGCASYTSSNSRVVQSQGDISISHTVQTIQNLSHWISMENCTNLTTHDFISIILHCISCLRVKLSIASFQISVRLTQLGGKTMTAILHQRGKPLTPTASYNHSAEKLLSKSCRISGHQHHILFSLNWKTIYNWNTKLFFWFKKKKKKPL